MKRTFGFLAVLFLGGTAASSAQVGVAAHAGTMGLGADVAVALAPRIGLRGGANIVPFTPKLTADDVNYEFNFPSPQFTAMLDLFLVGGLRLSGGVRIAADHLSATGELTQSVEIGDEIYSPSEVGTLTGTVTTRKAAPYFGIGFGNVAQSRVGFFMDLGLALHGTPEATLTATDGSLADDPLFQDDLQREADRFEDDISWYKFYPVLSLGISFGLK